MDPVAVTIVAGLVVAWSAVSRRVRHAPVTGPMVFLAAGLVLGDDGVGVLDVRVDGAVLHGLAEATLVLVLFSDAARLQVRRLRGNILLPARLLGISLPLVMVAGAAAATLLDGISGWSALIVGAVLAPTDAALGQAVVSDRSVPVRVRQTLNVESGLNDGLALPVVTLVVAAAAGEASGPTEAIGFVLRQIVVGAGSGAAVGALGGLLLDRSREAEWMARTGEQLAALAVGAAAWGTATLLGGNGFVGAFVGGLAFGALAQDRSGRLAEFAEEEGELLTLVTFLLVGAALLGTAIGTATVGTVLFALAALTVVRMVPTGLALLGTGLRGVTVAFIGWFGPRGLASLLFALLIVEEAALDVASRVLDIVALTVALSAVLHGVTAGPLAVRYARIVGRLPEQAGEHRDHPELPGRQSTWSRKSVTTDP